MGRAKRLNRSGVRAGLIDPARKRFEQKQAESLTLQKHLRIQLAKQAGLKHYLDPETKQMRRLPSEEGVSVRANNRSDVLPSDGVAAGGSGAVEGLPGVQPAQPSAGSEDRAPADA